MRRTDSRQPGVPDAHATGVRTPPRAEQVGTSSTTTGPTAPDRSATRGVVRGHVVTAVRVLRDRLTDSWALDALAREVNLSRSQLVRAFDATVGISPMAYLRKMRVERMGRLLVLTDLSVAEAARLVGWKNQFHASQCFHAHYGVSPTEYRRRQPARPLT